jgi:protein-S-isoprenylcysteine O-methyltransferase Ste14
VWSVPVGWTRGLVWAVYAAGWAILVVSTFLIGHFDLFGLRQVLARATGRRYAEPGFRQPLLYRFIRQPMMVGFLIAFWAAPDMSVGRLLFAAASTGYILVGVRFEERDLHRELGEPYRRYAERVPRFVPRPRVLSRRPRDRREPAVTGRREPAPAGQREPAVTGRWEPAPAGQREPAATGGAH